MLYSYYRFDVESLWILLFKLVLNYSIVFLSLASATCSFLVTIYSDTQSILLPQAQRLLLYYWVGRPSHQHASFLSYTHPNFCNGILATGNSRPMIEEIMFETNHMIAKSLSWLYHHLFSVLRAQSTKKQKRKWRWTLLWLCLSFIASDILSYVQWSSDEMLTVSKM